ASTDRVYAYHFGWLRYYHYKLYMSLVGEFLQHPKLVIRRFKQNATRTEKLYYHHFFYGTNKIIRILYITKHIVIFTSIFYNVLS
ncbi:hypothetical protein ACJX0J_040271, partial [Zea mays]